ncbi:MAG TPA: LysE family transporter [Clostridia bacterium]|nr:LysE family transporter [Clostridia bacterium]
MMPGPLLGVTIEGSLKRGFIAGPLIVLGHGLLELVLVLAMVLGLKDFFANSSVAGIIGLLGGSFLAWMGYDMIKSSLTKTVSLENTTGGRKISHNLILSGIIVSATNPYFILWWASTGMESVRQAYVLGLTGVLAFFIGHIMSDFTWYAAVAAAFARGKKLMNDTVYRWVILGLGTFIMLFSIKFITGGWRMLF